MSTPKTPLAKMVARARQGEADALSALQMNDVDVNLEKPHTTTRDTLNADYNYLAQLNIAAGHLMLHTLKRATKVGLRYID